MFDRRSRCLLLGCAFLILLVLSYLANVVFFETLNIMFQNQLLLFLMIFIHNVTVVSLILLGMTFYVNLVLLGFFKKEKYASILLENPSTFATVFALLVLFLSILLETNLFFGKIIVETLPLILLVSAPIGLIEGYGIYLTIKKTLKRNITMRGLIHIYGIFLVAAIAEVGLMSILR